MSKATKPQPKIFENSLRTLGNATRQLGILSASLEESNRRGDSTKAQFQLHGFKSEVKGRLRLGYSQAGPTAPGVQGDETTTENIRELVRNITECNETTQDTLGITREV